MSRLELLMQVSIIKWFFYTSLSAIFTIHIRSFIRNIRTKQYSTYGGASFLFPYKVGLYPGVVIILLIYALALVILMANTQVKYDELVLQILLGVIVSLIIESKYKKRSRGE